jgi:trk system potassium uptake protein TrkH
MPENSFKSDDLWVIIHNAGTALFWASFLLFFPLILGILEGERNFYSYLLAGAIVLLFGLALRLFPKTKTKSLKSMFGSALLFVIVFAFFGALPYYWQNFGYLNGFFETINALTGTGFAFFSASSLPKSLLLWRTILAWFANLAFISLASIGIFSLAEEKLKAFVKNPEDFENNFWLALNRFWKIYALATFIGFIFLSLTGLDYWNSLHYSMNAVSGAGFNSFDAGIFSLTGNVWTTIVLGLLTLFGAFAWISHWLAFSQKNYSIYWKDYESVWLLITLIVFAFLGGLKFVKFMPEHQMFLMQLLGSFAGNGFGQKILSSVSMALLSLAMIIGGSSGSNSSGIKIFRFRLFLKDLGYHLSELLETRKSYFGTRVLDRDYEKERKELENLLHIGAFLIVFILGAFLLSGVFGRGLGSSLLESLSAQTNVGLTNGLVNAAMPDSAKIILATQMILGKFEVLLTIFFFGWVLGRT